ncbi:MAG TPA: hypothetical protein DCO79_12020 [Spirochaeta sp.]|nr:hypothetical protein [Spirochaeta sp.]
MNDLKWFFPESGSECLNLFNDGFQPHAGGTFLIKTSLKLSGLFDINSVADYKILKNTDTGIVLGSAVSYTDAASFLHAASPGNIISVALSQAASTPLRNRISIGGSIASSPKWSDITAPLAASGAVLRFEGSSEDIDYAVYSADRKMRKNNLVSSVSVPLDSIKGSYYRFTFTGFDYPTFTLAVSKRSDDFFVCAVNGARDGLRVFKGNSDAVIAEASQTLSFNSERGMSEDYILSRAISELRRLFPKGGADDE